MAEQAVRPKVVWLESQRMFVEAYLDELAEAGFDVQFCRSIQETIAHLERQGPPDILIYENCLPTFGTGYSLEETAQGYRTGEVFVDRYIRPRYPTLRVWMLTTHAANSPVVKNRQRPNEHSWANAALDFLPSQLIRELRRILGS